MAEKVPNLQTAVLLVHGSLGPAPHLQKKSTADYLEPLAMRLCTQSGRACYLYDQIGCGLPTRQSLRISIGDLCDVLRFMHERLGEPEVHLIGHDIGGSMIMEALIHEKIWQTQGADQKQGLPILKSVCLMGTPSSSAILKKEAIRLLQEAKSDVGPEAAPMSFRHRHFCGLKSPTCLSVAYSPTGSEEDTAELWDTPVLRGWDMRRSEVSKSYRIAAGDAPLLSIRGDNDFVTDECVDAWRGVSDPALVPGLPPSVKGKVGDLQRITFAEEVIGGCGHYAHLEEPEAFAALLRLWLIGIEEPIRGRLRSLSRQEAQHTLSRWSSKRARTSQDIDLVQWARELPAIAGEPGSGTEAVRKALQLCAVEATVAALSADAMNAFPDDLPRVAIGLEDLDGAGLQAVACVEAIFCIREDPPPPSLHVMAYAEAPGAPPGTHSAMMRRMLELTQEVSAGMKSPRFLMPNFQ